MTLDKVHINYDDLIKNSLNRTLSFISIDNYKWLINEMLIVIAGM